MLCTNCKLEHENTIAVMTEDRVNNCILEKALCVRCFQDWLERRLALVN
jgi:hypothetical protein